MSQSAGPLAGFVLDAIVRKLPTHVRVYAVGGSVRDALLGMPASDRDWVVVGAQAQDLIDAGFLPVGQDFPVFLHPHTNEEYALARTERKSGRGYKGFVFHASPEVTLEQDLLRRDFTINAMAMDVSGQVIDPYGGRDDLQHRVFRHVSSAFEEDPLRVLRLARFLARFEYFSVASETKSLCKQIVAAGEMAHLVAERVFVELDRTMAAHKPSRGWSFLAELDAWSTLCNEVPAAWQSLISSHVTLLDSNQQGPVNRLTKWAWWLARAGKVEVIRHICTVLKVPNDIRDLACVWQVLEDFSGRSVTEPQRATEWIEFLARVDVYRKPERLEQVVLALSAISQNELVKQVLPNLIRDVVSGHFKQALRDYLQKHASEHPAQAVQAFRLEWVQRHLHGS